jgi:hypothetical protein
MKMKVSYEGIGEVVATFRVGAGVQAGQVVKMDDNGKVAGCNVGDRFCGVALAPVQGYGAVQVGGFAAVKYSGAAPAVGFVTLAADGQGGVKTDAANGAEVLVVAVDTSAATAVIRL